MKKRIISLLMAIVMVLGTLPAAVWAEDAGEESAADAVIREPAASEGGADMGDAAPEGGNAAAVENDVPAPGNGNDVPEDGDTAVPENGDAAQEDRISLLDAEKNVVSVTINGETTEYSNIIDAFEETVNYKNVNAAFKLLDDVELPNDERGFPGEIGFRSGGTSTLDLNGHTITHADTGYTDYNTVSVIDVGGGALTITGGGTIHGMYNTAAISVSGGSLTIDDGVTVEGEFVYGEKEFNGIKVTDKARAISINRGTLIAKDDTFTASSGVALEYTKGIVRLYGGRFSGMNIVTKDYYGTINEGVTVVDLLAPGYTYQHTDGSALEDYYVQNISDVKVVEGLAPVHYVDENGAAATVTDYIQIEPTTTEWKGGAVYVVRGNVTINGNVTVSGKMPSIILCDRASLTVNGGITLPDGSPLSLTIYGQTGGTGKMTVTNKSGAAFSCEGLAVLRLLNGTLTAAGKDTAFSNVTTWNQQGGNDEIKCIATGSDPEVWADGTTVPSVTLSRCTEHQWSYAQHASAEQHLKTCTLCGYNPNGAGKYENCVYDTYYGADESGHKKACICDRTERGAALTAHTPDYTANADGKTHTYRCTDCGFVSGVTEEHDYSKCDGVCILCGYACTHEAADKTVGSPTEGLCANCGKQVYEARLVLNKGEYYESVEYAETVAEALVRYQNGGPVVTLLCDVDMGMEALVVTYEVKGKILDLNGYTLSGSGDAVFQISQRYGFTIRNGKVENTGKGDAIQLIRGYDNDWGQIDSGNLTVENVTANAAKGWAIQVMDDADYADLNVKSGTFHGGLNAGTITGGHKIQLYDGTFIANPDTHSIYYPGTGLSLTGLVGHLKDMLAGGLTYGDADKNPINYFAAENRTIVGTTDRGYPEGVYFNAETVTIVEHTSHPIDRETGKCSICGAPCGHIETDKDGLCTACGARVMFCEVEGTLYKTIQAAQTVLKDRTDNPVIKLLDNYGYDVTLLGTANGYTLDLNGFRLTDGQMILYENRNLTIIDSSEKKTGSVGALWALKGYATIQDGIYAELIASNADSIKITGEGTVKIRKISMTGYTDGSNKKVVADLLDPGYAVYLVDENKQTETMVNGYYNKDNTGNLQQYLPGPYKDADTHLEDGQYYTVKAHTHDFADSTQTTCACGKTCTHDSVDADGKCAGCGKVFTAKVVDPDNTTTYYADGFYPNSENTRSGLDAAFAAVSSGSSVTVLGGSSVTAYLDGGKSLTLELGGKSASSIYVGRSEGANSLTVTGSGNIRSLYVHQNNEADLIGWTGEMEQLYVYSGGKATLKGGSFDKIVLNGNTAGSLLAPGYAFQRKDDSYVSYTAKDGELTAVKVIRCPHEDIENGRCGYCGTTGIAAVVNGEVYTTFDAAQDAWLRDGGTLKLYQDVTAATGISNKSWMGASGKTYTLDLNGCKVTAPGDDSGSTAPVYTITAGGMKLTVKDTSAAADGQLDNLALGVGSDLTLESGWLGMLTVPNNDTVKVQLKGGGLKGYDIKVPLAYVLQDGYDLDGAPSLWGYGSTGLQYTVEKAPAAFGGSKSGTMLYGRNKLPFQPTVMLDSSTPELTKIDIAWYLWDGINVKDLDNAALVKTKTGWIYTSTAVNADHSGLTIGCTYSVFAVAQATSSGNTPLWRAALTGYELTIGKGELSEATITKAGEGNTPAKDGRLVVDPWRGDAEDLATVTYEFTVNYYGKTLTKDTDYVVVSESDTAQHAGPHTLTIQGIGNYAGEAVQKWEIEPYQLGDICSADIYKDYDGTATLLREYMQPTNMTLFNKGVENVNPTAGSFSADTIKLNEGKDAELSNMSFDSAEAGKRMATFTVTLTNKDFVLSNGAKQMTVRMGRALNPYSSSYIEIKKRPGGTPQEGALSVMNDYAGTYTTELAGLLPTLESPMVYGKLTYVVKSVDLGNYYTDGAAVDANGRLTLPIRAVSTDVEGEIGTVTVTVSSANVQDITVTVKLNAVNKAVPVGAPELSSTELRYGDMLQSIRLSGNMLDNGRVVPGTFRWVQPNAQPGTETYTARWVFTPADTQRYAVVYGEVQLTVVGRPEEDIHDVAGKVVYVNKDGGEAGPVIGANVELVIGKRHISEATTDENGAFDLRGVTSGTYNVIVTVNTPQQKTVTAKLVIERTDGNVTMQPITLRTENINSTLDVENSLFDMIVGRLDKLAEKLFDTEFPNGGNGASMKADMDVAQQAPDPQDEEQTKIRDMVSNQELDFMTIQVVKRVGERTETLDDIGDLDLVLEMLVNYDTSRKDIKVYRYHEGRKGVEVTSFEENDTKTDGTFYIDYEKKCIHIFTSKFSTYAIGYTPESSNRYYYNGGTVGTKAGESPATGDVGLLPYAAMALTGCTGVVVLTFRRKREHE